MRYNTVIFDMDGTILDTLEDLANCLNYSLTQSGFPKRSIDEVRNFVGNGIRRLVALGVPDGSSEKIVERVYGDFLPYYKEHCSDRTKPYDGIIALLNSLKEGGCKVAVVSNKADYAVQDLCEQYFQGIFDIAVGERARIQRKPSPDSVNEVLSKLGSTNKDAVYIGDSEVDIMTANNAKMDSIIVSWGFRDKEFLREKGAKVIVSSPDEIRNIILM